jgi:mycofactocin precursor
MPFHATEATAPDDPAPAPGAPGGEGRTRGDDEAHLLAEEGLVEEISIDGMCGVY